MLKITNRTYKTEILQAILGLYIPDDVRDDRVIGRLANENITYGEVDIFIDRGCN